MYAIVQTGGKQYMVHEGDTISVEKLNVSEGEAVELEVLAVSKDGNLLSGTQLSGAKVSGKVIAHGKDKKIIVFKYKAKKDYRRTQGHRQPFTKVTIESIQC